MLVLKIVFNVKKQINALNATKAFIWTRKANVALVLLIVKLVKLFLLSVPHAMVFRIKIKIWKLVFVNSAILLIISLIVSHAISFALSALMDLTAFHLTFVKINASNALELEIEILQIIVNVILDFMKIILSRKTVPSAFQDV